MTNWKCDVIIIIDDLILVANKMKKMLNELSEALGKDKVVDGTFTMFNILQLLDKKKRETFLRFLDTPTSKDLDSLHKLWKEL